MSDNGDMTLYKKNTNKKVYNKKRLRWHKKQITYLDELSLNHNMPKNLLVGIYIIETSFRPWYFRIIEYLFVILGSVLNILFKRPFKNYTIGRCQIGVAAILNYHGKDIYKHTKHITDITMEDFFDIMRSIHYKTNLKICSDMVDTLYRRSLYTADNYSVQLCHVGEEYNGRYSYGLLLEDIVNLLDNNYFDI